MSDDRFMFEECKDRGHPDDHWQLVGLCRAPTLVAHHRNKPDPAVCGEPESYYVHTDAPRWQPEDAEMQHSFVAPTEPLVWGENAWRTNKCPASIHRDSVFEGSELVTEGGWDQCSCQCHWGQFYVNAYGIDRNMGGPEEGGWWYDSGTPVESVRFTTLREAEAYKIEAEVKFPRTRARYSMADSEADYDVMIEPKFAEPWPDQRPHYE
jgi:hypothetical protein